MLDPDDVAPERIRKIWRHEYDQMVASGMFEDERVELLYGALVEMSPQGERHAEAITRITEWLVAALAGRARVRPGLPFAASDDSEPEPDIAVVPTEDYASQHPARVFLLIEISASSLRKDRELKARLYAECGVPEYWVINLAAREIEIHSEPHDGRFTLTRTARGDQLVAPAAFPDVHAQVSALIPA